MTLLGRTVQYLRKQLSALTSVTASRAWFPFIHEIVSGGWQRNDDIAAITVISNPTLYACVTLIAGDIAKLRPKLVEQDANGIWTETTSTAFSPVLRKPNHFQTRIDFVEWWLISKLCHGNTYILKARDDRGVVRALYILDPYRVTPKVAPDGAVFYELQLDQQTQLANLRQSVIVPAREIIHDVCCPLFHPLCGVSPIYAAGFPALEGLNIRNASNKFLTNGSRPGGVLLVPGDLTQAQVDELKASWTATFSGDNQGSIAVLSGNMKYEPMGMTAEQSRLVEQLHMTDEDITKCFHMPRWKVGVGPDPTYNNGEIINKVYYSDCLQKHIEKIEALLDEGLGLTTVGGKTYGVELDRDGLFEMDTAGKSDAAAKGILAGMSPNEVRRRYWDLGPVAGGESPYLQEQNWPLRLLADRELPARTPTAPAPIEAPDDEEPEDEADLPDELAEASLAVRLIKHLEPAA